MYQMQIRRLPKPVIAMVNGYAIGGGHVLHVMCDLTIASENAIFGQRPVLRWEVLMPVSVLLIWHEWWEKKAREIWFLCNSILPRRLNRWNGEQGGASRPVGRYLCRVG